MSIQYELLHCKSENVPHNTKSNAISESLCNTPKCCAANSAGLKLRIWFSNNRGNTFSIQKMQNKQMHIEFLNGYFIHFCNFPALQNIHDFGCQPNSVLNND